MSLSRAVPVPVLQMSHAAVSGLCRAIKLQCELYSSRQIAICLDPYCGLGFVLWCLCRYDWRGERGKDELLAGYKWEMPVHVFICCKLPADVLT